MKPFLLFQFMVSRAHAQGIEWTDGSYALHLLHDDGEETRTRRDRPPGLLRWVEPAVAGLRRFELHRHRDRTGVSGTGVVVEGVEWADGACAIRWRGEITSTAVHHCISEVMFIHGHAGDTELVWLDPPPPEPDSSCG